MGRRKSVSTEHLFSPNGACYTPERDGSLDEYLETHDGTSTFPLFKGFDHFELLRKEGWLAPRMSIIRLMWNVGRGDEHFGVTDDYKLEGIANHAHGGREGIHDPVALLKDAPPFEAQKLLFPHMREEWRQFLEELKKPASA